MAGRTYKTEAVVLRSFRLGEADRVLHLYTLDRGRIGAVAKGIRKTKSRFGARLEPLSHVELMLHQGSGELQTVTGVDLVRSHHDAREQQYRLAVGLLGAEAMLRLFTEQEANARAFQALTRFLDLLDDLEPPLDVASGAGPARALLPAQAALAVRLPAAPDELRGVRDGDESARRLLRRRPEAPFASGCAAVDALALSPAGIAGIEGLLARPLAEAPDGRADATALAARRARGHHVRLRVLRQLPAADAAQRVGLVFNRSSASVQSLLERVVEPVEHTGDRQSLLLRASRGRAP